MKHRTPLLSIALCIMLCTSAVSLAQSAKFVVASGSIDAAYGQTTLSGTIGQTIIGVSTSSAAVGSLGFWTPVTMKAATAYSAETTTASLVNLSSSPNPVSTSATLAFSVPETSDVSLVLYNALGQSVLNVLDDKLNPGPVTKQVVLESLPSGSYTALLRIGNNQFSTSIILID